MRPQANAVSVYPQFRALGGMATLRGLAVTVLRAADVNRQRRQLAGLSDRQLADIGVTRNGAEAEAARPFWDLPADQAGKYGGF